MADHLRQQIRAAVLTRLLGRTTTGQNAFDGLFYPMAETELPCWLIVPGWTDVLKDRTVDVSSRIEDRTLTLTLRGFAKITSDPDPRYLDPVLKTLDTMCVEVRAALLADTDLNTLVQDFRINDEAGSIDSQGDRPAGMVELQIEIDYRVREDAPNVGV